jgi:hypothetical protein
LSWQTIPAAKEYDLYVGVSVTPKTVAAEICYVLVFYQSGWTAFLEVASNVI